MFYFVPKERNIAIEYISDDAIPVNITVTPWGWKICHYQTLKQKPTAPAPSTDLVQFIKSQPAYICQYYANIKYKLPEAEVYQATKATKKIIMATDGGVKVFEGSLGFVIIDSKNKVLISCYGRAAGRGSLSFRTKASAFLAAL